MSGPANGATSSAGGTDAAPGRKRLFVAFEIPAEQRAEAVARAERVRAVVPPARWLRPESMHVTLLFLGGVETAACEPLAAALRETAAGEPARRLTLRGFGCFPPGRRARVLWVGVDCAPDAASLHRGLAAAAAASGLSVAAEPTFRPHLTLARCPKPWAVPDAERLAIEYDEPLGPQFTAAEVVLYQSELGRGGARHLPYARLPLAEVAC